MFGASKPPSDATKPADSDTKPKSSPTSFESVTGTSVIGNDLTLLGEGITIVSQNRLQVDGDVRGNVHGKQVIITGHGSVEGMVCAEKIEVQGAVRGSIRAVSVSLQKTADVDGDIFHQSLAIAEGAKFDGAIRRPKDPADLRPVLDPEAIAAGRFNESGSEKF